jgi:hypothetical protein
MNVAVMKDLLKDQKDVLVGEFPYQHFLNGDEDNQGSKWTPFFAAQHGNIFLQYLYQNIQFSAC